MIVQRIGGTPGSIWVANAPARALDPFEPFSSSTTTLEPTPDLVAALGSVVDTLRAEALELDPNDETETDEDDIVETDAEIESARTISNQVRILVLGPVQISGWRRPPERAIVSELACYLALHRDRPLSGDGLRAALRPTGEREQAAKTLRTYMSLLRKALGPESFPAGASDGYRLGDDVALDWIEFSMLAAAGDHEADVAALRLIRGRPFEGVPEGTYGWVFSEFLVSEIEAAISKVAKRVAQAEFEAANLDAAIWGLRQGLLGVGTDVGLWELYVTVAGRVGSAAGARARHEARAALGMDAESLGPPK